MELKAKDLRIGNLVTFSEDGGIFTINEICGNGLGVENSSHATWIEIEEFESIQLTGKWLIKLGLEKRNLWVFEIFGDDQRGFHISSESGEWVFIKSVHQLQNLYFALTGEELVVK